jgi:hypothetical protein
MKFGITSVAIYAALSGGAAMAGAWAISAWSGLIVEPAQMWALYMSPFGLLYFI